MIQLLRALWRYREFVLHSVKREFQSRYVSSMLGVLWSILNPFSMILVYTLVLSNIMNARLPGVNSAFGYGVYLCAGILPWGYFSEIVSRGTGVFLGQSNLMKKLNFPRVCLPAVVIIDATLNFGIVMAIYLAFLMVTGYLPGLALLAIVPVILVQTALATGLGIGLGILNVFFRDVSQFVGIALQFWFWLTPIVYSDSMLPSEIREYIFLLNPMAPLIQAYQGIFVGGHFPDWSSLVMPAVIAAFLNFAAFGLFRSRSGEMIDEL